MNHCISFHSSEIFLVCHICWKGLLSCSTTLFSRYLRRSAIMESFQEVLLLLRLFINSFFFFIWRLSSCIGKFNMRFLRRHFILQYFTVAQLFKLFSQVFIILFVVQFARIIFEYNFTTTLYDLRYTI